MRAATITNSGWRELDRKLAALEKSVPDDHQLAALRAGGEVIAAEMRRLAPVDTGTLRDSIVVTDAREGRIYGKVDLPAMSVFIGPAGSTEDGDVYYARFQEFGWLDHPGSPFMRPAVATKRPEAERVVASMLSADIARLTR